MSLMGCLITREPVYEAPIDLPPSVHGSSETPMFEITKVDLDLTGGADSGIGGASNEIRITAIVRDANIRDALVGRVFLNLNRSMSRPQDFLVREIERIPPELGEDPYSRRVEFTIDTVELRPPGCHRIELHVSRAFEGLPSLNPVDGDLGIGVWYRASFDRPNPNPLMDNCLSSGSL